MVNRSNSTILSCCEFALQASPIMGEVMKKLLVFATFSLTTMLLFCGCAKKTTQYYAKKAGFDFGFAVGTGDIVQDFTTKIINENASILVAENCMKTVNLRPNKTFWNWSDVDNLVNYALEHKMQVKFHTLFWHVQNAAWISAFKTEKQASDFMEDHVKTILTRYKGKIRDYDVVNEMFNEDGSFRENVWYKTMGSGYIEKALRLARDADPTAHLYLNDFNNENMGNPKADAMYNMIKDFVARGVPIDGVGFQLHLDASLPYDEDAIRANVRRYKDLGLEVSFSEVDVRIPQTEPEKYLEAQKDVYCSLLKIAMEEPNVKSFILWGISDKTSWVPSSFPGYGSALLYDSQYNPKPVYTEMMNMLKKG